MPSHTSLFPAEFPTESFPSFARYHPVPTSYAVIPAYTFPVLLRVTFPPVSVLAPIVQPPIVPDAADSTPALVTLNTELAPRDIPSVPIYTPELASVRVALPFPIYVLLITNPLAAVPIYPLVAVIAPVIVADVAVNAPRDVTENVPLPLLYATPVIVPPVIVSPVIAPAAIFAAVIDPAAILSADKVPAFITEAFNERTYAVSMYTPLPSTLNGLILFESACPLGTISNLSACIINEDVVDDEATLKPATRSPAVTSNTY